MRKKNFVLGWKVIRILNPHPHFVFKNVLYVSCLKCLCLKTLPLRSPATAQLGHFSVSDKLTTGATELAGIEQKYSSISFSQSI